MADAYIEAQRRIDRGEDRGQIDTSFRPEQLAEFSKRMDVLTIREQKKAIGLYKDLAKAMEDMDRLREEIVGLKRKLGV